MTLPAPVRFPRPIRNAFLCSNFIFFKKLAIDAFVSWSQRSKGVHPSCIRTHEQTYNIYGERERIKRDKDVERQADRDISKWIQIYVHVDIYQRETDRQPTDT